MNNQTLIASAPAELLLGLGIFFGLAAIVLLLLSAEAGNYREITIWWQAIRRCRLRPRRRWHFNREAPQRSNIELAT